MEQIAINILPKGVKPVCHSSQFDEGRQIRFNLFNDDTPYTLSGTETISVLVRKPDGAEVVDSVTNTSDSYVIWDVSADACELSGVCECEFSIVENGIVLGSKNFTMKVEEDAYGGRNIEVRTASGRIATFNTNMVEPFKSLKSDINPVQSGTGTPSPQNVRPISGFSALNVTLADGDMQTVDTATVNFGQTVYGGVADVTNGKVNVTHGYIDLGSLTWIKQATNLFYATDGSIKANTVCICDSYAYQNSSRPPTRNDKTINTSIYFASHAISIYDTDYDDVDTFKASLSGKYCVYELVTPIEITTTPENLTAISGENNVYGDTNGDTTVEYYIEV